MSRCSKHGINWNAECYECDGKAPESARGSFAAPSGSRTCHDCKHCGKPAGPYIRCEHPALVASCEPDAHDMREFAPDFAQECDDFENAELSNRA
jgi:hypothetical protein